MKKILLFLIICLSLCICASADDVSDMLSGKQDFVILGSIKDIENDIIVVTVDYVLDSSESGLIGTDIKVNKFSYSYCVDHVPQSFNNPIVSDNVVMSIDQSGDVYKVKNGSYKVSRPFNIVIRQDITAEAQDFINFIMSSDGQAVIESGGYIAVSDAPAYTGFVTSGKVVVSGSSSVTPIMEKLKEAYVARNPHVTVEVQQSDSSTGVSDTIDSSCDIGMASRELKDSEIAKGVSSSVIALDGIAVVVNKENPVDSLTSEQVKNIFTGETKLWSEVVQ